MVRVGDRDELILPLPGDKIGGDGLFKAYDPATGKELWRCAGLGNEVYAMPVVSAKGDLVVGISGHNAHAGRAPAAAAISPRLISLAKAKNPSASAAGSQFISGRLMASPGTKPTPTKSSGRAAERPAVGLVDTGRGRIYVNNLEGSLHPGGGAQVQAPAKSIGETIHAAPAVSNGESSCVRPPYCIGPLAEIPRGEPRIRSRPRRRRASRKRPGGKYQEINGNRSDSPSRRYSLNRLAKEEPWRSRSIGVGSCRYP